ncbi:MAG: MATE family efflux transporter [Sorangiineae bacterium]|nr:MATE family efflux transporter [Polyangiaceae bacterium]MEB2321413.1 MATE family efflux transporter [Sorangiineae bacterium]
MSETRSVAREVLRLTGPAVMTSFLQTLVFLTDRLMLGRFSEPALASMQVQGAIVWSVFNVFAGLTVGTVPLIARAVGARDPERASNIARAALRVSLVLGVLVGGLGLAFLRPLVDAIGPESESLRELSREYLRVIYFGFPQMFLATTAAMVMHGAGNTRTPFIIGLASNALHVIADVVLIFGVKLGPLTLPAFGVAGAAAASVVAFSVEAALLLWVLRRPGAPVTVLGLFGSAGDRAADARRALLRVSAPALLERIAIHAGYLLYAALVSRLGALVMAGNQALLTLESICWLSADGFGIAAAAVVGQALGRDAEKSARAAALIAAGLAALVLTALGLALWATAPFTLAAFVPRGEPSAPLVSTGLRALPLLAAAQPFMAVAVVLAQSLRGAGDTRSPMLSALAGGLLVRVGALYWLGVVRGLGLEGVWIASGVDWVVRTLIIGVIFARGRWAKIRI